jgi:hypothetical protein
MSPRELTYDEVVEAGLPATCTTMADPHDRGGRGVLREWRYENGQTWLIFRDDERVYSMRMAVPAEIPWSGWHHDDRCDCPFCSEGVGRPEHKSRSDTDPGSGN